MFTLAVTPSAAYPLLHSKDTEEGRAKQPLIAAHDRVTDHIAIDSSRAHGRERQRVQRGRFDHAITEA